MTAFGRSLRAATSAAKGGSDLGTEGLLGLGFAERGRSRRTVPVRDSGRWGSEWGGADEAAAVWFKRTKNRLANGKNKAASRALGYLAHFIGDVAQPMHTDSSDKEDGVHSSYESAVDSRTGDYGFSYDGMDNAKAGATVRKLARQAHKKYLALVNAYDAHSYNPKVHRITKRQLKRAANAMADLLSALGPLSVDRFALRPQRPLTASRSLRSLSGIECILFYQEAPTARPSHDLGSPPEVESLQDVGDVLSSRSS